MRRSEIFTCGAGVAAASLILLVACLMVRAGEPDSSGLIVVGAQHFADSRDPPSLRPLNEQEKAHFDLGHAVFNTHWVPAGTPRAQRRDGLGPLFNADSCDACHNEGARGRGPDSEGGAPLSLVVKLDSPGSAAGENSAGDPVYGHVLNPLALPGVRPEGRVTIHYESAPGRYPDGTEFALRRPRYEISNLGFGPLGAHTILEPRIAPAVFGVGLLQAVPERVLTSPGGTGAVAWRILGGVRSIGRFGWQATGVSIQDQTSQAFSREMGITTSDRPHDDCSAREPECLAQANGGDPEASAELFDAVIAFQRLLAVPASPRRGSANGEALFTSLGCATCHTPRLPTEWTDSSGTSRSGVTAPYTDLRLHDLGVGLADREASGTAVPSRWRTAPLWGMGYRLSRESAPRFLHDGRARTVEEAILWHGGEAAMTRERFMNLPADARQALLDWVGAI
jgi:CxxC motif-containing protein (DUF1111 family)